MMDIEIGQIETFKCDCVNVNHTHQTCGDLATKVCMNCQRTFCEYCAEIHHKCDIGGVTYDSLGEE